jgi:hypothetical protein
MPEMSTENDDRETDPSRMEGLKMQYVAIVETDSSRSFHGPYNSPEDAVEWMGALYPDRKKGLVEILHKPQPVPSTHPDQTTIEDHIDAVHDHIG